MHGLGLHIIFQLHLMIYIFFDLWNHKANLVYKKNYNKNINYNLQKNNDNEYRSINMFNSCYNIHVFNVSLLKNENILTDRVGN